jgi:hypothetical protein
VAVFQILSWGKDNKEEKSMSRAIMIKLLIIPLLLLVSGISGAGCVSGRGRAGVPPTAYTCDWCGQVFYIQHDPASVTSDSLYYTGESLRPEVAGLFGGQPRAKVRAKTNLIRDEKGHNFCSLKCQNAFLASKDIKEERKRVIIGE